MFDNYQNLTRLLRGTNAGSDAVVASWNMQSKQMQIPAYNSVNAFTGSAVANLAIDSSGNILTVANSGGGSVTSVAGTGTVNGISLTGTVTTSGNITLGGTLSNVQSSQLATSSLMIGTTNIALGATGSSLAGLTSINATSITGSFTGSFIGIHTGSLFGTASYATQASSASYYGGTVTSASYSNNSTSASYALSASWAPVQVSASYALTASYVSGYVATSATSSMSVSSASYAATASSINPLIQNVTVTGSILVNSSAVTLGQFVGNQNGYIEFSVRNTNNGVSASGDIAVYADTGTVLNNYIDMGINNSGLTSSYFYGGANFGAALDAYVYNAGGNLRVGNATSASPSQSLFLFSNPTATPDITITGSRVGIAKSSLLNATLDVNGNAIVTGSLIVTNGITGSLFGTSSWANSSATASYITGYVLTSATSSMTVLSSSYALSASWAPGGAGATPGGNTGEIQYNNAGTFAGAANVEIKDGNLNLISTTDPTNLPTASIILYSKDIAGRQMPKWVGPAGVDTPIQPNIMFNQISLIGPGGGTTIGVINCTVTTVGTISNPNITTTNLKSQTRRIVNTSAATAGALASTRISTLECWRGSVAGQGGFFSLARFGFTTLAVGQRMFIGLDSNATAAPTNIDYQTSTTTGKIGMYATGSTGVNWSLIYNAVAAVPTVVPLGASFPVDTTSLYEMILFAKPNDTAVSYRITNMSTNVQISGSISTNLPASATPLGRLVAGCNNATAASMAWDVSRFGLETDY